MKKILCICLAAALVVCCLAACGQEDAFEAYQTAQAKMKDVKSLEMRVEGSIELSANGMNIPMNTQMDIKEIVRSQTDIDIAMTATADLMGNPITTESYFTGGYLYTAANGTKAKTAMPLEDVLNSIGKMPKFDDKAVFKSITLENKNNVRTIRYELNEEFLSTMVSSLLDSIMPQMNDMIGGEMEFEISLKSYTGEISMDKDYNITSEHTLMQMEMALMGQTVQVSYDLTNHILGYNSVEKIDFPADLDSYVEQ